MVGDQRLEIDLLPELVTLKAAHAPLRSQVNDVVSVHDGHGIKEGGHGASALSASDTGGSIRSTCCWVAFTIREFSWQQ